MEGFKQLWEHMQSMDRTSEKIAYGAGVAAGTVGVAAGVVCGTKIAFDWVIDRYDEFETRSIERIMRKIDANRKDGNKRISVSSRGMLTKPKSDMHASIILNKDIHIHIALETVYYVLRAYNDFEVLRRSHGKVQIQNV